MKRLFRSLALAVVLPAAASAQVLTFEGIAPVNSQPGSNTAPIGNYYNGGAGPNYGIEFSSNALALCLVIAGDPCSNTSRGGQGDPTSQRGSLLWLSGPNTYMNKATGFTDGFSFFYTAVSTPGSFSVWSGMSGTGLLLATLVLPLTGDGSGTPGCFGVNYCPFAPAGVNFVGTAQSVTFGGGANQIVFDDVTFGSSIPGQDPIPEPASMTLLGTGLVGLFGAARRRRKAKQDLVA
jgi:hypothetical protein